MKRHKSLIHTLLQYAEEYAKGKSIEAPATDGYSMCQVHYHIGLCVEAGFLHAKNITAPRFGDTYDKWEILSLTWKGHEVLEPFS